MCIRDRVKVGNPSSDIHILTSVKEKTVVLGQVYLHTGEDILTYFPLKNSYLMFNIHR